MVATKVLVHLVHPLLRLLIWQIMSLLLQTSQQMSQAIQYSLFNFFSTHCFLNTQHVFIKTCQQSQETHCLLYSFECALLLMSFLNSPTSVIILILLPIPTSSSFRHLFPKNHVYLFHICSRKLAALTFAFWQLFVYCFTVDLILHTMFHFIFAILKGRSQFNHFTDVQTGSAVLSSKWVSQGLAFWSFASKL